MDPLTEDYCIHLLRGLVGYLKPRQNVADMTLSEVKVVLYPWSQNYFGNLLVPEFRAILEGLVARRHTPMDHYMKALEFAYTREIKGLQTCYGNEEWTKAITKAEHMVMIQNTPPLTNLDAINKFIKKILKNDKPSKKTKVDDSENTAMMNIGDKVLKSVIERFVVSKPPPSPPKVTEVKKIDVKDSSSNEPKNKKESTEKHENMTRQRKKAANSLLTSHFPIFLEFKETNEDEIYTQISTKEKTMLEYMKYLHKRSKHFTKPIQFWHRGFSFIYVFWMNLVVSNRKHSQEGRNINDYYKDPDDAIFLSILGQQHADALHKKEFQAIKDALFLVSRKEIDDNADDDEYFKSKVQEESKEGPRIISKFNLWKSYYYLLSNKDDSNCKWRYNFNFVSIQVFLAFLKNKLIIVNMEGEGANIHESCYTILNSAFDFYLQNIPPPHIASSRDTSRDERYSEICDNINERISRRGRKDENPKWLQDLKWEKIWNLIGVLPESHPLYKIISPPKATTTATIKKIKSKKMDAVQNKMSEHDLDMKTQERLYQWWFQRPFFYSHVIRE